MNESVIVVTGVYLGWDCVVGVFKGVSKEKLIIEFPKEGYILTEISIHYNTDCF